MTEQTTTKYLLCHVDASTVGIADQGVQTIWNRWLTQPHAVIYPTMRIDRMQPLAIEGLCGEANRVEIGGLIGAVSLVLNKLAKCYTLNIGQITPVVYLPACVGVKRDFRAFERLSHNEYLLQHLPTLEIRASEKRRC